MQKIAKENLGQQVRSIAFSDDAVREVYEALKNFSELYAVGGAVRDLAIGTVPKDIDLLASGILPQSIETLLNMLPGQVDFTGKQFGVWRYRSPEGDEVEIALPRTEYSTGEGHKDFEVTTDPFLPVEEDLERRDFTANAMAVNLATGELLDPFNGQHDISQNRLKMVNPQAFRDDPLRILRAYVAMARHGLRPDEDTEKAIRKESYRLRALPEQRIQLELDKLFAGRDPESAVRAMRDDGVLHYIMPEVAATIDFDQKNKHHRKKLDEHLLEVLRKVAEESNDPDLRLAALLHDIGKPASYWEDEEGYGHYYKKIHKDPVTHKPTGDESGANHEEVGAQMTNDMMKRLRYSNARGKRVSHLVRHHMYNAPDDFKKTRKFINTVGPEHAHDLITLRHGDQEGKGTDEWENQTPISLQRQMVDRVLEDEYSNNPGMSEGRRPHQVGLANLAVNGRDLAAEGIPQSSEMGRILNKLLEAVMNQPELNTKEQLLEMAHNLHMMKDAAVKEGSILDEIKEELDPAVFENAGAEMPNVKPKIRHFIKRHIYKVLRENGYQDPADWIHLVLTGSLTTYQWTHTSDMDVSVWVEGDIPDFKRAELVSLMVEYVDGVIVDGTTHPLQAYVVPSGAGMDDLYRPGLRSGYDIDSGKWIVLPEKNRAMDIDKEMKAELSYARMMADKMRLLLIYDPPGAKQFWEQLRWHHWRDQAAGRGDYTSSNIVYKYLEKHHLTPGMEKTANEFNWFKAAEDAFSWELRMTGSAEKAHEAAQRAAQEAGADMTQAWSIAEDLKKHHKDTVTPGSEVFDQPKFEQGIGEAAKQVFHEFKTNEPDWHPLETYFNKTILRAGATPHPERCGDFMFMGYIDPGHPEGLAGDMLTGLRIYKHGETRRSIHLDSLGEKLYLFNGAGAPGWDSYQQSNALGMLWRVYDFIVEDLAKERPNASVEEIFQFLKERDANIAQWYKDNPDPSGPPAPY